MEFKMRFLKTNILILSMTFISIVAEAQSNADFTVVKEESEDLSTVKYEIYFDLNALENSGVKNFKYPDAPAAQEGHRRESDPGGFSLESQSILFKFTISRDKEDNTPQLHIDFDIADYLDHKIVSSHLNFSRTDHGDLNKLLDALNISYNYNDINFIGGKQNIALGLPTYAGPSIVDPLYNVTNLQQVIGVQVTTKLRKAIDALKIWVADSTEFDNLWGPGSSSYGIIIRKKILDSLEFLYSYGDIQNSQLQLASISYSNNDKFKVSATRATIDRDNNLLKSTYDQITVATKVLGVTAAIDFTQMDVGKRHLVFSINKGYKNYNVGLSAGAKFDSLYRVRYFYGVGATVLIK